MNPRRRRLVASGMAGLALFLTACEVPGRPCGKEPLFTASPCGDGKDSGKTTMRVGQTATLTLPPGYGFLPLGAAVADECPVQIATWMSSNPGVASVEGATSGGASTGTVRALATGTTEVSVVVQWNSGSTGTTRATFGPGGSSSLNPGTCTVTVTN